jgi:hypothetical protein
VTVALCAVFFLSGVSALLFETLWFREAGLVFGNGIWASSLYSISICGSAKQPVQHWHGRCWKQAHVS